MHLAKDDAIIVWGLLGIGVVIVSLGAVFTYEPPALQPVGEQVTNHTDDRDVSEYEDELRPPQDFIITNGDEFRLTDDLDIALFSLPVSPGSASAEPRRGGHGGGGGDDGDEVDGGGGNGGGNGGGSDGRTLTFSYNLTLSHDIINAGSDMTTTATTNNTGITQVTFSWKDPSNNIAVSSIKQVTVGDVRIAIDIFTVPDRNGLWTLDAHFQNESGNDVALLSENFVIILSPTINFNYTLTLDKNEVQVGDTITATADTNDTNITDVVFVWANPEGDIRESQVRTVDLGTMTAEDSFIPDEQGQWRVDARFNNVTHADTTTRSKEFIVHERGGTDNHPPVAVNDTTTTLEDKAVIVNVLANDSDPDGDPIFVSSFTRAGNGSVTDNHNGTMTYTPMVNHNGQDSFSYKISDGSIESNVATMTISITPANDPPTADAGPDQNVNEESIVSLNGSSTDVDEDNLIFFWAQLSGPSITFDAVDLLNPSFITPSVNHTDPVNLQLTLTFELVVRDDEGAIFSDTAAVIVNDVNKAPVADAGPDQIVNESILCQENEEEKDCDEKDEDDDYDNTEVNLSLESKDDNHDEEEDEDCKELDDNNAIEAMSGDKHDDDDDKEECPNPTIVMLSGGGSDPDDDPLTFRWKQTDGPPVELDDNNSPTPSFTAPEVDEDTLLTFELTVSDDFGGILTDSVDILVLDVDSDLPSEEMKVTGGGGLGKDVNFGCVVRSGDKAEEITGQLEYHDRDSDIQLHSMSMTSLTVNEKRDEVIFEGIARINGEGEFIFIVTVVDHGEPGDDDKFTITIPDLDYTLGGTLTRGNVQIHK